MIAELQLVVWRFFASDKGVETILVKDCFSEIYELLEDKARKEYSPARAFHYLNRGLQEMSTKTEFIQDISFLRVKGSQNWTSLQPLFLIADDFDDNSMSSYWTFGDGSNPNDYMEVEEAGQQLSIKKAVAAKGIHWMLWNSPFLVNNTYVEVDTDFYGNDATDTRGGIVLLTSNGTYFIYVGCYEATKFKLYLAKFNSTSTDRLQLLGSPTFPVDLGIYNPIKLKVEYNKGVFTFYTKKTGEVDYIQKATYDIDLTGEAQAGLIGYSPSIAAVIGNAVFFDNFKVDKIRKYEVKKVLSAEYKDNELTPKSTGDLESEYGAGRWRWENDSGTPEHYTRESNRFGVHPKLSTDMDIRIFHSAIPYKLTTLTDEMNDIINFEEAYQYLIIDYVVQKISGGDLTSYYNELRSMQMDIRDKLPNRMSVVREEMRRVKWPSFSSTYASLWNK